jgi:hypothetical protein
LLTFFFFQEFIDTINVLRKFACCHPRNLHPGRIFLEALNKLRLLLVGKKLKTVLKVAQEFNFQSEWPQDVAVTEECLVIQTVKRIVHDS